MFVISTRLFIAVLVETLLVLSAVPALAYAGYFPYSYRMAPAFIVIFLSLFRMFQEKWTLQKLGLAPSQPFAGLSVHLTLTFLGATFTYAFITWYYKDWRPFPLQGWMVAVSLFLSFVQELIFRTFMIESLEDRNWKKWQILWLTSLTFSFIHIIYPHHTLMFMALTFAFSWMATLLYFRYRNLYLVTLSHFVLNLLVLYLGLHT
ncbi:MAG: CPBP family intramembrane metalloprotease [Bdellovibrionales bacterium]|nr:CPBP family intramembrane metalloprotease [Bdellovibrionales bacterium]